VIDLEGTGEHEIKKTLRQLQAEQDDEDRFQADLEQAMRQSLGNESDGIPFVMRGRRFLLCSRYFCLQSLI